MQSTFQRHRKGPDPQKLSLNKILKLALQTQYITDLIYVYLLTYLKI